MRAISPSTQFKRDFKQECKRRGKVPLDALLAPVLELLCQDQPLPARMRDHALTGPLAGTRECHLQPDLLLIYFKRADDLLVLVRLGSHSELF